MMTSLFKYIFSIRNIFFSIFPTIRLFLRVLSNIFLEGGRGRGEGKGGGEGGRGRGEGKGGGSP